MPQQRKRLRDVPLHRLFPNMITLGALCFGLSAVRFAMLGRFEMAMAFLLAAAILDGLDGRVARMLKASSEFGAQLDSLSDFVCFGVAPALVLHMWILNDIRGFGWAAALFYAICCGLRLARFNTALHDEPEPWEKHFFTGVPAPAGAMLALAPLALSLGDGFGLQLPAMAVLLYTVLMGLLMASRLPTFSAKARIKRDYILPIMLLAGLAIACLLIRPWVALVVLSGVYLAAIAVSGAVYLRLKAKHASHGQA